MQSQDWVIAFGPVQATPPPRETAEHDAFVRFWSDFRGLSKKVMSWFANRHLTRSMQDPSPLRAVGQLSELGAGQYARDQLFVLPPQT